MRLVIICIMALYLTACAGFNPITGPEMTPEMQKVTPVENPDSCQFIKAVYYEVSQPAWIHAYACKNVVKQGGDSYKIVSTREEMVSGMRVTGVNINVYKCR